MIKIQYLGANDTIAFAAHELKRHIERMRGEECACMQREEYDPCLTDTLWVGEDEAFAAFLPEVKDPALDDAVYAKLRHGRGIVTGTNARSVLLAIYRLLRECGWDWIRPGAEGEIVPNIRFADLQMEICEAASYRHRGICIEGAVSYDNVSSMIEWLPKVGLNAYFNQFHVPYIFYKRWYTHENNPLLAPGEITPEEVQGMVDDQLREIQKRGLFYHETGHGWTCDPFGQRGLGWEKEQDALPKAFKKYLAELNGERELFGDILLNTNLCYGQEEVREKVTDAIVTYCHNRPEVDYLHFWLADGWNNHCECELCKDTLPADFYVKMLNLLDEKMEKAGLSTRVVFLAYVDLLWEPKEETLRNPDRFVLMFAPITRSYSKPYSAADLAKEVVLEPYARNKLTMPRDVETNLARMRRWQDFFGGDSFLYEYHFMWGHFADPGNAAISRVLFDDMEYLKEMGLNGQMSCQVQRAFFPTGLGLRLMAAALWDRDSDYDTLSHAFFRKAFGERGNLAKAYLENLTELFDPDYLRGEKKENSRLAEIEPLIEEFKPVIRDEWRKQEAPAVKRSWQLLRWHAQLCKRFARALLAHEQGEAEKAERRWRKMEHYVQSMELDIQMEFDVFQFLQTTRQIAAAWKE